MKCPVCHVSNQAEVNSCAQCGSDLSIHKTLNRLKDFSVVTPANVFSDEKVMPTRVEGKLALTLGVVSCLSLLGLVILSVFFANVVGKLDTLTKEIDTLRAQAQAKVEVNRREKEQDKLLEIETLSSLASSLQATTQLLSQEVKGRRDLEAREKLASARSTQAPE